MGRTRSDEGDGAAYGAGEGQGGQYGAGEERAGRGVRVGRGRGASGRVRSGGG